MIKKILISALIFTAASSSMAADLAACVEHFRKYVGRDFPVSLKTYDAYVPYAADYTEDIAQKSRAQPEFKQAIWDYLALAVDAERVEDGRTVLRTYAPALSRIEAQYKLDPETVVAFFGVETNYGKIMGKYPVIDATLSRACLKPDNDERRKQLFAALWLVQEGHVQASDFRGSWAGAFGMTQFMPGTFVDNMADMDEDGKSDIVHSTADALGTTARYVQKLRWQPGLPWALEVKLPTALEGQGVSEKEHACLSKGGGGACKSLATWQAEGVTPVGAENWEALSARFSGLSQGTQMALIQPIQGGPAWLATRNFQAMWGYNQADAYALAIGLLSDALRGKGLNKTPWPVSDLGLSRREIRQLQQTLLNRGYCEITPDGIAGAKTQEAIRMEEQKLGWTPSGRPGQKILTALSTTSDKPGAGCAGTSPQ